MRQVFRLTLYGTLLLSMAIPLHTQTTSPLPESLENGDWGVTVDAADSTRFADHLDNDVRSRSVRAALWGRRVSSIGEEGELDLAVQGSYNWSRADVFLNLDLARARFLFPQIGGPGTAVDLSMGRIAFRDPSGLVFNHTADGISGRVATPRTRVRVSGAYTGLQLNPISNVRMSATDRLEEDDDSETFGPRRVVLMSEFRFPELVGRHTPELALVGQFDARDTSSGDHTVHSGYAVMGMSGRLAGRLYGDIFGAFTAGVYDDDNDDETYTGFLASARLRLFLPDLLSSRLSLRAVYASNTEDEIDRFIPITRTVPGTILGIPLENLMVGEASYSFRPFVGSDSLRAQRVQVALTSRVFFSATDEPPVEEPFGADPSGDLFIQDDPDSRYIGTEAVLGINTRIASDFGLGLNAGMFFPGTGSSGVFTSDRKPEGLFRLSLSTRL